MSVKGTYTGGRMRAPWGVLRIVFAIVVLAAVFTQLSLTVTNAVNKGRDVALVVQNFFSFFTMLSNCLTAAFLIIGGIWLLSRGRTTRWEPRWLSFAFVSVSTYMIITGVVYNLLLRNEPMTEPTSAPWANEVLHLVCPAFMLIELVAAIARRPLPWTALGFSMLFPIAWITFSLWRGANISNPENGAPYWYPYPFLDPYVQPNGFFGVGMYIVVIAATVMLIAAAGVARTRMRARKDLRDDEDPVAAAEPEPATTANVVAAETVASADGASHPGVASQQSTTVERAL